MSDITLTADVRCSDSKFCRMPAVKVMSDILITLLLQAVLAALAVRAVPASAWFDRHDRVAQPLPVFV
jgi:hypothetical protein